MKLNIDLAPTFLDLAGVLVVAGSHFFYGGCERSPHAHECVRLTYSQDGASVRAGIRILAEEVRRAYAGAGAPAVP